jgi:hypothetical protein
MTDYKMTDEMRKKLTEFLGERWHVPYRFWDYGCGMMREVTNRTFTTDADMMAVFRKIRDVGKLSNFDMFCQDIFLEYTGYDNICDMCNEYQNWLFLDNPERACCLAAMFLEEQG